MRLLARLFPARRLQTVLAARDLTVGFIQGRLRRRYPYFVEPDINLKLLEELARARRNASSLSLFFDVLLPKNDPPLIGQASRRAPACYPVEFLLRL